MDFYGQQYPSIALLTAAKALNLTSKDIKAAMGESVSVGGKTIRTDNLGEMYTYFYKDRNGQSAFPIDSFFDVYSGKIPACKYADKIVLIGATAAGVGANMVTPISAQMNPVTTLAHSVSSILQEHFFVVPTWAGIATLAAYVLVALYIILLLPKLTAGKGAMITGALVVVIFAAHLGLMTGAGLWVQLMLPLTLLLVGHALLTTKRYLVTERGKEAADVASAESNRMLGLAFQQQGQLDMAFDKFRKAPLNEEVMENMYSLALDFERRRQFNKAESVFRYMSTFNPKFRDIEERLGRNKALSETIILGGSGGRAHQRRHDDPAGRHAGKADARALPGGKGTGQGRDGGGVRRQGSEDRARRRHQDHGVVGGVRGRRAGRCEGALLPRSRDGRAPHAPEHRHHLRRGRGARPVLHRHGVPEGQGPRAVHQAAEPAAARQGALDRRARGRRAGLRAPMGIVHRDIKPANIMYEPESDTAKVTDFGIARITDSSKTKTGMVLGTPSYMSPEQLAGKKIDGRSDLFSLGVTLFQMLSGRLPFEGESMTQLMFAIANNPHPQIREINPTLPEWIDAIIDMALAKDLEKRYQTGAAFAEAIRQARKAA